MLISVVSFIVMVLAPGRPLAWWVWSQMLDGYFRIGSIHQAYVLNIQTFSSLRTLANTE